MFNLTDASLKKHENNLYSLNVSGLAEKRPSIICGDGVVV